MTRYEIQSYWVNKVNELERELLKRKDPDMRVIISTRIMTIKQFIEMLEELD